MSKYATKSTPIFLCESDEIALHRALHRAIPTLRVVDGNLWNSTSPPIKDSISDCKINVVYLWDPEVFPVLPFEELGNGKVRGPGSGVVIKYMRCMYQDGILSSGDMGVGFERQNTAMSRFVSRVWRTAKSLNACTLSSIDPTTGAVMNEDIADYIVGPGAREMSRLGVRLKHCAADVFYKASD